MQVAEAGLIEWRQTQGTLRVGRGLGKGRVLVVGEGGREAPPGTDATLRSSPMSSGLPSGTLFAHLCRLAFIERWVGGPSTEVVSAQGGRTRSSALALGFLDGPTPLPSAQMLSASAVRPLHAAACCMPSSCCSGDRVHSPSGKPQPASTDLGLPSLNLAAS